MARTVLFEKFTLFAFSLVLLALPGPEGGAHRVAAVGSVDRLALEHGPHGQHARAGRQWQRSGSVSTVQNCAYINENGIMDADEDAVDTVYFDAIVGPVGIPGADGLAGIALGINYDNTKLRVINPFGAYSLPPRLPAHGRRRCGGPC